MILFSNPSSLSLEKGRFDGSAQTRKTEVVSACRLEEFAANASDAEVKNNQNNDTSSAGRRSLVVGVESVIGKRYRFIGWSL